MSLHAQAWRALTDVEPPAVTLRGATQGLLPARTPCFEAMVAAVSAGLQGIAVLDGVRSGTAPSEVGLDTEHVAVAATSERYGHLVGQPPPVSFAPLSRFWRTADGWLRTHGNYPWHRERLLAVLASDEDDVDRAIAERDGSQLEQALFDAGGLGVVVRTPEEWASHPQGASYRGRGLVEWHYVGERRALPPGRFLDGVRVLDLTRVIAGPTCTRVLAAWGADVLRLDPPHLPEIEGQAVDALSGKRSASLDLRTAEGLQRLHELLGQADVLVHAYRPGAIEAFGLSPAELAERHPHLSVVSLSAWGTDGPWGRRRGFDSLVQAATGIAVVECSEEQPGVLPAQVLDHATGHLAAAAAALALADGPRHAQLSLVQTAHWLLAVGTRPADDAVPVDAERWMTTLRGGGREVRVVAPLGRIGEASPQWRSTTSLGADAPAF